MTTSFIRYPKTSMASLAVAALGALTVTPASANDIMARVISSTPVVQQIAVPRQVCSNQTVVTQGRTGGGAVIGAVAGGAIGNAIGQGSGRTAATLIGLVGGAVLGNQIEGGSPQAQNVQQCSTQTFYENRPTAYNVVYEFQGTQYSVQTATDPGQFIRLQVTPAGAVNPSFAPPAPISQNYIQPAPVYVQPIVSAPAPVYISEPVYVPRYVAPVYYAPNYYQRPYYPNAAISLNLGYTKNIGGGHHGHHGHHGHRDYRDNGPGYRR
jgi:uncharacterized protein YcfJ